MSAVAVADTVASPCTGVCRMHAATGWCAGCLRSIDEIAGWGQASADARRAVLQQLPERRAAWRALGLPEAPPPTRPR